MSIRDIVNQCEKIRYVKKRDIIKVEDHNNFVDLFKYIYNYFSNVLSKINKNIININHICPEGDYSSYKILYNNIISLSTKYNVEDVDIVFVGFVDYYFPTVSLFYNNYKYSIQIIFSLINNNIVKILNEEEEKIGFYNFFRTIYDKYTILITSISENKMKPCLTSFDKFICIDTEVNTEKILNNLAGYSISFDGRYFIYSELYNYGNNNVDIRLLIAEFY